MKREDLVRMQRSLAMAPSLTGRQANELLEELDRLLVREPLLDELRQVVPQVLAIIDELIDLTPAS